MSDFEQLKNYYKKYLQPSPKSCPYTLCKTNNNSSPYKKKCLHTECV